MAVPVMWIRKNMLQSHGFDRSSQERKMSNEIPMDELPSSRRDSSVKRSLVTGMTSLTLETPTVFRDTVPSAEIESSSSTDQATHGAYEINRISPKKKSPPPSRHESPSKSSNSHKNIAKSKQVSQTFPRVSPSRKIQNINIVLPQRSKIPKFIMTTDLDEADDETSFIVDMTKDSLDSTNCTMMNDHEPYITAKSKIFQMTNCQMKSEKSFCRSSSTSKQAADDVKCELSSGEKFSIADNYKLRATSTPRGSPVFITSDCSDSIMGKENRLPSSIAISLHAQDPINHAKQRKQSFASTRPNAISSSILSTGNNINKVEPIALTDRPPIPQPRTIAPINERSSITIDASRINISTNEQCDSCKGISFERLQPTPLPISQGSVGYLRMKNVLTPIREKSPESSLSQARATSPCYEDSTSLLSLSLDGSTHKSAKLERIVRMHNKRRNNVANKSLVSEIIEELNERCNVSKQSTYVIPGSKNFVKKLVSALENGVAASNQGDNEEADRCDNFEIYDDNAREDYGNEDEEDFFIGSENDSDDDIKSAALSTSISYKDTDSISSDTDVESPTMYNHDTYDWNMNVDKNRDKTITKNKMDNKNKNNKNNNNDSKDRTRNNNQRNETTILPSVDKRGEKEEEGEWLYWTRRPECNLPRTSSLLSIISSVSSSRAERKSHWTRRPECTLPRTSSLLSIISSVSSSRAERKSPCLSPIRCFNDPEKFFTGRRSDRPQINARGATYRTNEPPRIIKPPFRVNETTILDSGYSDRSSIRSARSSYCNNDDDEITWIDYTTETTRTIASENNASYYYSDVPHNSFSSTPKKTNGRRFVI